MNAKRTFDEIEDAGATLAQLRELASQFESKYSFVTRITSPHEYKRATAMLDELTGGRELGPNEEALLDELSTAIATYEETSAQFKSFNERWGRKLKPVELLKALMESSGLKGHELPEIGDKTVVSKVLNGSRRISHKMAIALGQRFHMAPDAFLEDSFVELDQSLPGHSFRKTKSVSEMLAHQALLYPSLQASSHRLNPCVFLGNAIEKASLLPTELFVTKPAADWTVVARAVGEHDTSVLMRRNDGAFIVSIDTD